MTEEQASMLRGRLAAFDRQKIAVDNIKRVIGAMRNQPQFTPDQRKAFVGMLDLCGVIIPEDEAGDLFREAFQYLLNEAMAKLDKI